MPATRARISTCRELSVCASHSNVIGTSRGSTFTAVTSIVWLVATRLSCFLQPTAKSIQASTQTSAFVRGLKPIPFISSHPWLLPGGRSYHSEEQCARREDHAVELLRRYATLLQTQHELPRLSPPSTRILAMIGCHQGVVPRAPAAEHGQGGHGVDVGVG